MGIRGGPSLYPCVEPEHRSSGSLLKFHVQLVTLPDSPPVQEVGWPLALPGGPDGVKQGTSDKSPAGMQTCLPPGSSDRELGVSS